MDVGGRRIDVGLGCGAQPEAEAVHIVLAACRAVPARTEAEADPMDVVLCGENRQ
jgi:hypothetical protein